MCCYLSCRWKSLGAAWTHYWESMLPVDMFPTADFSAIQAEQRSLTYFKRCTEVYPGPTHDRSVLYFDGFRLKNGHARCLSEAAGSSPDLVRLPRSSSSGGDRSRERFFDIPTFKARGEGLLPPLRFDKTELEIIFVPCLPMQRQSPTTQHTTRKPEPQCTVYGAALLLIDIRV